MYHAKTKHIDIKFHFSREKVDGDVIALEYNPTDEMVANGLTKSLPRVKHTKSITNSTLAV